jgi:hypothetical protein
VIGKKHGTIFALIAVKREKDKKLIAGSRVNQKILDTKNRKDVDVG